MWPSTHVVELQHDYQFLGPWFPHTAKANSPSVHCRHTSLPMIKTRRRMESCWSPYPSRPLHPYPKQPKEHEPQQATSKIKINKHSKEKCLETFPNELFLEGPAVSNLTSSTSKSASELEVIGRGWDFSHQTLRLRFAKVFQMFFQAFENLEKFGYFLCSLKRLKRGRCGNDLCGLG